MYTKFKFLSLTPLYMKSLCGAMVAFWPTIQEDRDQIPALQIIFFLIFSKMFELIISMFDIGAATNLS